MVRSQLLFCSVLLKPHLHAKGYQCLNFGYKCMCYIVLSMLWYNAYRVQLYGFRSSRYFVGCRIKFDLSQV